MTLHTPRLLLRELEPDDAPALNEIERDSHVTRYLPFDPQSLEQSQEYIAGAIQERAEQPRLTYDLAILPRTMGTLIGRCGLGIKRPEHREASIWYVLSPRGWGQGYAAEAATAMLDLAFGDLGLHRVWADCDPRNTASCRVAEKLGMICEGRLRENYFLKGEWCGTALYAILDREWRSRGKEC